MAKTVITIDPGKSGGYAVQHTRLAYLMGPDGGPIALIPQEGGAQAITEELDRWVK